MKEFWNQRYAKVDYAYGVKPNVFFENQLATIPKGTILFAAEGEGRNAVFAAQHDFEVYAFDISTQGQQKAINLAQEKKVHLDYCVSSIENLSYPEAFFDAIVFIFAHFPAENRASYFHKIISFLKPNGRVLFEGFSKLQLEFKSGGPQNKDLLFSEEEIRKEFPELHFTLLETLETHLDEGPFHQGKASVIRFVGIKKVLK